MNFITDIVIHNEFQAFQQAYIISTIIIIISNILFWLIGENLLKLERNSLASKLMYCIIIILITQILIPLCTFG